LNLGCSFFNSKYAVFLFYNTEAGSSSSFLEILKPDHLGKQKWFP